MGPGTRRWGFLIAGIVSGAGSVPCSGLTVCWPRLRREVTGRRGILATILASRRGHCGQHLAGEGGCNTSHAANLACRHLGAVCSPRVRPKLSHLDPALVVEHVVRGGASLGGLQWNMRRPVLVLSGTALEKTTLPRVGGSC